MFTCCCHLWVPLAMSLPTSRWAAQKRSCCSSVPMKLCRAHSLRIGASISSETSPQCPKSTATRCFWWSLYMCEVITLVNIVLCAFKTLDGGQCICAEIKWQLQKSSNIKVYVLCTGSHLPQAGRLYIVAFYVRHIKWQEILWCLSVVGFKSAMKHGRPFPRGNHTHHVWFVCHPHTSPSGWSHRVTSLLEDTSLLTQTEITYKISINWKTGRTEAWWEQSSYTFLGF